ncbi:UNVERIFIED_CONTAM: ribosomal protein RPL18 [Hammondia hammondi]|eukprot:XP_008888411.1 ribosomal protein RPL18 [Hammondia hammondi]
MGVDLERNGRKKKGGRRTVKSQNPYLRLLVKLYQFLARRTNSRFNAVVLKRLMNPKRLKAPMSLSKLARHMKGKEDHIAVLVGSVTDDIRMVHAPKLTVCALRFSETARRRLEKAGGECLTFDQLALRRPKGSKCVLLRATTKSREADKHFGAAPGTPGSKARPYVRSTGRKFEKARGRRKSRGYKN